MQRTLALTKDTLIELGSGDLAGVVGGSAGPTCRTCVECLIPDTGSRPPLPSIDVVCS